MKRCIICGGLYQAHPASGKQTCSKACAKLFRERKSKEILESKPKRKCKICGESFYPRFKEQTTCGAMECVLESKAKTSRKQTMRPCIVCGKPFPAAPSSKKKTCGPKCSRILFKQVHANLSESEKRREMRKCKICGKEFEVSLSSIRTTCSLECAKKIIAGTVP